MVKDYLSQERVLFLQGRSKLDVFEELAGALARDCAPIEKETLLEEIWKRELFLSTRVSQNIAMPHAIIHEVDRSSIAIGLSPVGIPYEDSKEDLPVNIVVMLIGTDSEHLPVLTEIASQLSNKELCRDLLAAGTQADAYRLLTEPYRPQHPKQPAEGGPAAASLVRQALAVAEESGATKLVIHADALEDTSCLDRLETDRELILVTTDRSRFTDASGRTVVFVPFNRENRSTQVEVSLLFLLSQGLLQKGEKVVSVFGYPGSGGFDSIFFTDVDREFELYFAFQSGERPHDPNQPVFTRVLQIANEIAVEGREGKPVGTLFVVGDYENVRRYCQQLIINPFQGYREEERNILDPSLDDTIKEYSRIDGAFVVRGDGVIMTAGTYLRADSPVARFQAGLGARHAAAATITSLTRAVAVSVSESTGKISLFRSGERFLHF